MGYVGFDKLKSQIAAKGGVRDPGAVAASIGRKKYGAEKFNKAAAAGKSMKGMISHLPKGVSQTPEGDIGAHRAAEAYEMGTFKGCKSMTKEKAGWKPMRKHQEHD